MEERRSSVKGISVRKHHHILGICLVNFPERLCISGLMLGLTTILESQLC